MEFSYSLQNAKRTVIDIQATSKLLKDLRNKNGFSVKQLQDIFGFETPVAIYAWENEKCKNIPCIENFDILSKLYNCHVEELYILKQVDLSDLQVRENTPEYGTFRTLANHLLEGLADIEEGRVQDFGMINDACLTELTPEWVNENGEGRCTVEKGGKLLTAVFC
jgi:transcriptional regulator with XRE-family HTH domain